MIDHDCGTLEIASAQSLMDPCGATAYKRCVYKIHLGELVQCTT